MTQPTPHSPPSPAAPLSDAHPGDPPRAINPRARRHAWAEPRVRPLWILALVLLVIAGWYVTGKLISSSRGRWLVANGIKGEAEFLKVGDQTLPHKRFLPDPHLTVTMEIRLPGRKPYTLTDVTLPGNRDPVECRTTVPIWVDPSDPARFTTNTHYALHDVLLVAFLLVPVALLLGAVSLLRRRRLLNTFRAGQAAVAVVVGTSSSPVAPLSRIVRCTLRDARGGQVFPVIVPNRLGPLHEGDNIWVIVDPDRPSSAILGALYQ